MMPRISARSFFTIVVAGAAACSDSAAPVGRVTESLLTRDVAIDAADATVQDLAQIAGIELMAGMPLASSSTSAASPFAGCTYNPSSLLIGCPSVTTPDGLTLNRFFEIFAADTMQRTYDAVATDSLLSSTWLTGTLAKSDRTVWLSHSRLMMVTGLTGSETKRTWRGFGTRDDSAHINKDGVVRTTRVISTDEIHDLVYRVPRADFPFPQSGTVTNEVTVSSTTPNGTEATNRQGTRHVVITFDGTQTASVLVGSTACSLDLVSRKLTCE